MISCGGMDCTLSAESKCLIWYPGLSVGIMTETLLGLLRPSELQSDADALSRLCVMRSFQFTMGVLTRSVSKTVQRSKDDCL